MDTEEEAIWMMEEIDQWCQMGTILCNIEKSNIARKLEDGILTSKMEIVAQDNNQKMKSTLITKTLRDK